LEGIERRLTEVEGVERGRLVDRMGALQHDFEHLGGYEMRTRAEAALSGLGFSESEFAKPFETFSGGWRMRAELARTLIGQPDTLLLDEPSNYLDVPAVEWLQRFLKGFAGTLMLISHDRYLLESLTDCTLEVSHGRVTRYAGGYGDYVRERAARLHRQRAAKKSQDRKLAQTERFIERFRAKNTKATQVQSRIKRLEKIDRLEVPEEDLAVSLIRIPEPPHCGAEVLRLEDISHSYDGDRWILRGVELRLERGDKVAVVGYNGMGKTTLLRLMAGQIEPRAGRRVVGHQVVVGYQSQDFAETMPPEVSAYHIVREASANSTDKEVRTILGGFGFSGDAVTKPCGVLSGGEKIRLAFARLFVNPPNCLILDEPTTHLDIQGRQALETALQRYRGTVCLVSHDIAFMRSVAERIVAMEPPGIRCYVGGYDDYIGKRGALDTPAPARDVGRSAPPAAEPKATRRERARQRDADKERRKELNRQAREAERSIEALEEEQARLTERLTVGEAVDYAETNRRLQAIPAELRHWMHRWEEAVEALER
jgi:ATP-binding cassette subfamily F protein 3